MPSCLLDARLCLGIRKFIVEKLGCTVKLQEAVSMQVVYSYYIFIERFSPQVEASPATGAEGSQTSSSSSEPLSPRQRRAQQQGPQAPRAAREPAASRALFNPAPHHPQNQSYAGSAVLILVLTLALAVLIVRRIYSANEYKFNYDL